MCLQLSSFLASEAVHSRLLAVPRTPTTYHYQALPDEEALLRIGISHRLLSLQLLQPIRLITIWRRSLSSCKTLSSLEQLQQTRHSPGRNEKWRGTQPSIFLRCIRVDYVAAENNPPAFQINSSLRVCVCFWPLVRTSCWRGSHTKLEEGSTGESEPRSEKKPRRPINQAAGSRPFCLAT